MRRILISCFLLATVSFSSGQIAPFSEEAIRDAINGREATLVFIDCASRKSIAFPAEAAKEQLAPCSTFKIINALIGFETGILTSPNQRFYKWDGEQRLIPAWNKDLALKEAFRVSCVPAFQDLARQIGAERMQIWIDRIGYGDRNTSAGIDVFWLPAKGRETILISPIEQADLMRKLVTGKLPVSGGSLANLKELMRIEITDNGTLYGKTGSRTDDQGVFNLGWFVGFVESRGTTYAFACVAKGKNVMGKDAQAIVEGVLKQENLL